MDDMDRIAKMVDIKKVKNGLQCIIDGSVRCENCGYAEDKHGSLSCQQKCVKEAIALLDELEIMMERTYPYNQ